jgi:AAA domain
MTAMPAEQPCEQCGAPVRVATRREDGSTYWQCMDCAIAEAKRIAFGDTRDAGDSISTSPRRTRWTAAELLAHRFPPPRWSVHGLLPEGLTLFVGAPKIGKSWLQLGLGVAVATGGVALGKLDVVEGDVLYLALEDRPRRLQERLRKVLNGGEAPKRLTIELSCPPLPLGGRTLIGEWIKDHPQARLVMIDVLARVRGVPAAGVSAYDADYLAVAAAKDLADEHGVAVVVAHHDRKLKADDWLDSVSGTHGLAAAADTVAVLSRPRGKADGHLKITGRDVDEAEYALAFDPVLAQWNLLEGPALDHLVGDTRAAILGRLRAAGPARPKEVADALELDHELVKKTLQRMADAGQAVSDGSGSYSLPGTPENVSLLSPLSPGGFTR